MRQDCIEISTIDEKKYLHYWFLGVNIFFASAPEIELRSGTKYFAQIAQLVEQRTENPRVTGSIPVLGMFLFLNLDFQGLFFLI